MLATFATLLPAFFIIAASAVVGRKTLTAEAIKGLSGLTFNLLLPALLFRAMVGFHIDAHYARALFGYFAISVALMLLLSVWYCRRESLTLTAALARAFGSVFSNTVQMGIPLTALAFGQAGLSVLLSLVAIHALVILTIATVIAEFGQAQGNTTSWHTALLPAIRSAVIHPVILPILAGMLCTLLGIGLPAWLDSGLKYLGDAAGPLCLVLLGAQLTQVSLGESAKPALTITFFKNILHPALVFATLYLLEVRGVPLLVLTSVAALPVGNNAFLFAQRYDSEVNTITTAIAISTALCAISYPLVLTVIKLI